MGTARLYGQNRKIVVNSMDKLDAIIENYYVYAGQNITAGSFVEFIEGVASQTTTTTNTTVTYEQTLLEEKNQASTILAERINSTQVFVAYRGEFGDSYGGKCTVLTIANGTISKGTSTTFCSLSSNTSRCYNLDMVLLSSTKAILTYALQSSSSSSYVQPVTISGTTITLGETTSVSSVMGIRLAKYSSSLAYMAYAVSSTGLKVRSIDFDATSLSVKNTLHSISLSDVDEILTFGYNSSSEALLCVAHNSLAKVICYRLTGTSTVSSTKSSSASADTDQFTKDCRIITTNKIIFAWGTGGSTSTTGYLRARVFSLSSNTLTAGTIVDFDSYKNSGGIRNPIIGPLYSNSSLFLIAYTEGVANYGNRMCTVSVSGTTLTLGNIVSDGSYGSIHHGLVSIESDSILVWKGVTDYYDYNYAKYFKVSASSIVPYSYVKTTTTTNTTKEIQVRLATKSSVDGIAKTSGTGGTSTAHNQAIDIYTK